jgi:hypothetical protein
MLDHPSANAGIHGDGYAELRRWCRTGRRLPGSAQTFRIMELLFQHA